MRVLITGGGGFVGAAVARSLAARGDEVVAFDRAFPDDFRPDDFRQGLAGVSCVEGDITDAPSLYRSFAAAPVDAVVHCAAIVGVLAGLSPADMVRINIAGSVNLFEAMVFSGVRRVIHISSEEVLGPFQCDRADEDHPTRPVMAYGVSKLAVEGLGRTYREQCGIEAINLRTSWVYGPGLPRPRVPKVFVDAALEGRALHLPWGFDTRIDHTYIADIVTGVLLALDCKAHPFDTYNIASDSAPSLGEIAAIVNELVPGARISVGPGPYMHRQGVPAVRKGALAADRARQAIGYMPKFDIRAGLAASLEAAAGREKGENT